jgi:putative DNA primase/helicase
MVDGKIGVEELKKTIDWAKINDFQLIPLRLKDKLPAVNSWKELQERKLTLGEIANYFDNGQCNVGVICGKISHNLCVLDFDDPALYDLFISQQKNLNTRIAKTSKGYHIYIKTITPIKKGRFLFFNSSLNFVGRVDIQGEGSYVVAAPSIHPTGVRYSWLNNNNVVELPIGDLELFNILKNFAEKNNLQIKGDRDLIDFEAPQAEGGRNEAAIRYVTYLRKIGLDANASMNELIKWNQRNKPPLLPPELISIVQSAFRPAKPYSYTEVKRKIMTDENSAKIKLEEIIHFIAKLRRDNESIPFKWLAFEFASYLLLKYNFITPKDSKEILVYDNGIYRPIADTLIDWEVRENLKIDGNLNLVKEIAGHIKGLTYIERKDLEINKQFICTQNGIYDLNKVEFKEHSPEYLFLTQVPITYNPNESCPNIQKFLSEVLSVDDKQKIIELIGYCLLRGYPIHKAFMFVGDGANGKSTLINLIKTFLGEENCASVSLQELESNRFAAGALYGRLANLYPDLSPTALSATGKFKILTGEDSIGTEKKFKDFFSFKNYAKLIFSCNQIPIAHDDTSAFWRRWEIISFPNQFIGNKADKNLLEKLTTAEELSGLFNIALKAVMGLLIKGEFSNTKGVDEIKEQYIRMSDCVGAFIMDCIEADPNGYMIKQELYSMFCEYCRILGYSPISDGTFAKRLQHHLKLQSFRPQSKDIAGRPHCWAGLKPKPIESISVQVVQVVHDISPFKFGKDELIYIKRGNKVVHLDHLDEQEELKT